MNCHEVIHTRLLVASLIFLFALGCTSSHGALEVGWGNPAPHPDVQAVHRNGPPPHAPAHGYRARHSYRYYPANEVYYDTDRRIYFYFEDGAWIADALLPYQVRMSLGGFETVELYADTPYEYHRKYKSEGHPKVPPGQAKKGKGWNKY